MRRLRPWTWRRWVVFFIAATLAISAIPLGMRAYLLNDYWTLIDGTAITTVAAIAGMFLSLMALAGAYGYAAYTRPWLRHWGFGTLVTYFAMGIMATISGHADFADGWVKLRMLAVALPVGALWILVMRAWAARRSQG